MPRIVIASALSASLVVIGIGLLGIFLPSHSDVGMTKEDNLVALKPAEEDCQLIEAKVEKLRKIPTGGNCSEYDDCAMINQSCSSVPKAKAQKANEEFERLYSKAREMNCDVGYLICEFVSASCRENTCVVERAILEEPEAPRL